MVWLLRQFGNPLKVHSMEELEDVYFDAGFARTKFLRGGREVLDAIAGFWDGLNEDSLNPLDDSSKWLLSLP